MIISDEKLDLLVAVLRQMGARRVLLFGSFVESPSSAKDIDIGVAGIPLRRLLDADVAVNDTLDAETDLVSQEEDPEFFALVEEHARVLYDEG